ncbi:MAG TPA: hypothetical protein VII82_14970 [Polyangiaceae bacterium]
MKRSEIWKRLEPPPGGLARLHARMNARPSVARRRATVALSFALAAAVLLLFFTSRRHAIDPVAAARQQGAAPAITLGLAPMPAGTVAIDGDDRATTALVEVRTSNPRVSFYWVSSTSWRD